MNHENGQYVDTHDEHDLLTTLITINKITMSMATIKITLTLNKMTETLIKYSQTQQTATAPTPHRPHLQLPRSSKILGKSNFLQFSVKILRRTIINFNYNIFFLTFREYKSEYKQKFRPFSQYEYIGDGRM